MSYVVFVGGPIQHAVTKGSFHAPTRGLIEQLLLDLEARGLKTLSAHRVEAYGEVDMSTEWNAVSRRDIAWMRMADAFVAVLPNDPGGGPMRTDGTCVELGWASALDRPIILVRDSAAIHSHLIRGLAAVARVQELEFDAVARDVGLVHEAIETFRAAERSGAQAQAQA
ncbi:MAG: nucleoside 2-deoxyribosyltransferase [Methylocystis sp.]|uniref:nucleoside 2-deoxyribosyltransferase n=1 Tax=Phenylobacterium sp. TaxID=1871053 RepID=UPI0025EE1559|nr:nucleoside 2-deoxyribosyltransferase [Phenylobacterium sp.]MCA3585161.1 nucleoside 2-deoxyribosyltransferase [Methylocystis sp.]MCA6286264.1 nucleoside 2-deoxyribosyltransferase [Phenylobacterium sp.]MCA6289320.1 nucleoside 2-deoxyribosyltransferase [Phenylobacterium sp.]MCA6346646.1 nucleoside 2-deoxyribosyltransferase [Phenylobacterium sp.]MCA6349242.1 nucleoside 2-deoxyribosyltransferase [Phenylobacterium sp.]